MPRINWSGMDRSTSDIHEALQQVEQFRQRRMLDPDLAAASVQVKRFQADRFKATYADFLHDPRYQTTAHFFLNELYSDKDYSQRDQQFARIASTISKLFPQPVVDTAAALADVHALTEELDDRVASEWMTHETPHDLRAACALYIHCWRTATDRAKRTRQLQLVLHLGGELDRLIRKPGLRGLLKMMRRPAGAAGLSSLQRFLEAGFDAFTAMGGADEFLGRVKQRETEWMGELFDSDAVACETKLAELIAQTPS